jgi:Spy/CpxP family protein refolding chaperone
MVAFMLVPALVFAQSKTQETPAQVAKQQTDWMQKNLDLTQEQLEQVKDVNLKYAEKRQKVYASTDEKDAKMNHLTENREEHTEELREILTPEQFTKLQEQEKQWFENAKSKIGDSN